MWLERSEQGGTGSEICLREDPAENRRCVVNEVSSNEVRSTARVIEVR